MAIATIILAAGGSSRLGRPKQLVRWGNSTLIRRAAKAAVDASLGPVGVVLGAHITKVSEELIGSGVQTIINENWTRGLNTSIQCGMTWIEGIRPDATAALLMLCDQPHVTAQTLRDLGDIFNAKSPVCVASQYADTLGTPAIFRADVFLKLKQLEHGGAKFLIQALGSEVLPYPFQEGEIDIDTPQDLLNVCVV